MRNSQRSREGELMIDERACLGGRLFESATVTCAHCIRVVVLNPDRSRSRGYCRKCDHYVCDLCDGKECTPRKEIMLRRQELFFRQEVDRQLGREILRKTLRAP
jgi:hypothetical protein